MNRADLTGRLTATPEVRFGGANNTAIARFTLAVDRKYKRDGEPTADFISCVAFGNTAEFIEKYFTKGMRVGIEGRIQTGSYVNKDGNKVYTTDVVCEQVEFEESKRDSQPTQRAMPNSDDGFMNIPDGIEEELPFN